MEPSSGKDAGNDSRTAGQRGPEQTEAALCRWALSAEEEKRECQKEAELLEKLRKDLRKLEEKKKEQEDILLSAGDAARKADRELAAAKAELKGLSDSVEFSSREEAQRQKQEAESGKDRAREAYEKAEKRSRRIKGKNAGDRDADRRIPGGPARHGGETCEKTAEYQAAMTGRGLEESRWRLLTETYREESVERLREETGSYRSSRKAAADLRDSMREAIGNRKTPDREKLEREAEQAEERLKAAERARTMIRTLRKDNEEVYQSLQPGWKNGGRLSWNMEDWMRSTAWSPETSAVPEWIWRLMCRDIIWRGSCGRPTGDSGKCRRASSSFGCMGLRKPAKGKTGDWILWSIPM